MTTNIRIALYLILVAVVALALWGINHWDNGRIQSAYDHGVSVERAAWVKEKLDAEQAAATATQEATAASEAAADTTRATDGARAAATEARTQSTVETIVHEHSSSPLPDCSPAPVPDGVLQALDRARAAALGQTDATKG